MHTGVHTPAPGLELEAQGLSEQVVRVLVPPLRRQPLCPRTTSVPTQYPLSTTPLVAPYPTAVPRPCTTVPRQHHAPDSTTPPIQYHATGSTYLTSKPRAWSRK
eukprot:3804051-Rhodomonas_salina.1